MFETIIFLVASALIGFMVRVAEAQYKGENVFDGGKAVAYMAAAVIVCVLLYTLFPVR